MSQNSSIEWTDTTWNPVRGCTKVSPGCAHCYAETFAERWRGIAGHPYEQGFDLRLVPEKLREPLTWKKPRRVFVNSMSDLFQDGVSFAYVDQVCAVMAFARQHTFQVLTKRADRMLAYFSERARTAEWWKQAARGLGLALEYEGISLVPFPLPNVWLGVSVENQHFADERLPLLLKTPAAVRFISAEPLLGPLDLRNVSGWLDALSSGQPVLDWVIVGGESGPQARPFNMEWGRSLIAQCRDARVPVFIKQLGADPFEPYSDGSRLTDVRLRSRKGGDLAEWPEDLRVREFPLAGEAQARPR